MNDEKKKKLTLWVNSGSAEVTTRKQWRRRTFISNERERKDNDQRDEAMGTVPSVVNRDSLARLDGWMDLGMLRTGMDCSFVETSILN